MSLNLRPLWLDGWFVSVCSSSCDRVHIKCDMYMRDWDFETGEPDILKADPQPDSDPNRCLVCDEIPGEHPLENNRMPCPAGCGNQLSIRSAGSWHAIFHLCPEGPAEMIDPPANWGHQPMHPKMADAIAPYLLSAHFPQYQAFQERIDQERAAYWERVTALAAAQLAQPDKWEALRAKRKMVDQLIGWVDPPATTELEHTIPEPNIEEV